MSSFQNVLAQVAKDLDLSAEVRRAILDELAADLEGIRKAALQNGDSEKAAVAKAIDFVDMSPDAIAALARVHGSPTRQWLESMPKTTRTRLERCLSFFVGLFMIYLAVKVFGEGKHLRAGGWVVWISTALLAATCTYALVGFYRYRLVNDHRAHTIRQRSRFMRQMALAQIGLALVGLLVSVIVEWTQLDELHQLSGKDAMQVPILFLARRSAIISFAGLGALFSFWLTRRYQTQYELLDTEELNLPTTGPADCTISPLQSS